MIKVYTKDKTVWFQVINYEFITAARVICRIYGNYNKIPVVTSACDGKHDPESWHYKGLGWDFRIWGIDDPTTVVNEMQLCADKIRQELQVIDYHYDVVYGDEKHLDHLHIEYDLNKKRP